MDNTKIRIDLTPKIVNVTADVEVYFDGRCVGTMTVDLTPEPAAAGDTAPAESTHGG